MTRELVIFDAGEHRCALDSAAARAFLPLPRLWRTPSLPRVIEGYADIGGRAVPVVALARLFTQSARGSEEPPIYSHLILIDGHEPREGPVAFLVDRVVELRRVSAADLTVSIDRDSLNNCVEAEAEIDGRLVHVLDTSRLLLAEEASALAELDREAERRRAEWKLDG